VTVVTNPITSVQIEPETTSVRTGDVVRFAFRARGRGGKSVEGIEPEWSLSPGNGQIEEDGHFVAETPAGTG
jgi:hypothetical protein